MEIPGVANPNTTKFSGGAKPSFIYVYFENVMAKGEVAQWSDTAGKLGWGVEDAVAGSTRVAGVVPEAVTAVGWGWLQCGGYCDYVLTDGNVTAPNADTLQTDCFLIANATPYATGQTVAELETAASSIGTNSVFAINLTVDDATPVTTCILCCKYRY
jgi:hypothetical protein